jgi:hypothetical protein
LASAAFIGAAILIFSTTCDCAFTFAIGCIPYARRIYCVHTDCTIPQTHQR